MRAAAAKPGNLNAIPRTRMVEGTYARKLPCDRQARARAHTRTHPVTNQEGRKIRGNIIYLRTEEPTQKFNSSIRSNSVKNCFVILSSYELRLSMVKPILPST